MLGPRAKSLRPRQSSAAPPAGGCFSTLRRHPLRGAPVGVREPGSEPGSEKPVGSKSWGEAWVEGAGRSAPLPTPAVLTELSLRLPDSRLARWQNQTGTLANGSLSTRSRSRSAAAASRVAYIVTRLCHHHELQRPRLARTGLVCCQTTIKPSTSSSTSDCYHYISGTPTATNRIDGTIDIGAVAT